MIFLARFSEVTLKDLRESYTVQLIALNSISHQCHSTYVYYTSCIIYLAPENSFPCLFQISEAFCHFWLNTGYFTFRGSKETSCLSILYWARYFFSPPLSSFYHPFTFWPTDYDQILKMIFHPSVYFFQVKIAIYLHNNRLHANFKVICKYIVYIIIETSLKCFHWTVYTKLTYCYFYMCKHAFTLSSLHSHYIVL